MKNYQWKKVSFKNTRGQQLAGLIYTAGIQDSPTLIVCHGFTGSKEGGGKAVNMAEYYSAAGFDTLLFDFAGNGESEGNFEDLTLSTQIDDLNSAVDWCKNRGAGTIVTMGRSFGGTTVLCHAAGDHRVAGVCTWAAAARLVELFTGFADDDPDDPEKVVLAGDEGMLYLKKSFFNDIKKYNIPLLASQITPRPLLIIHGTKDDVVHPDDARMIYEGAGTSGELVYIQEGDHQFEVHHRQVWDICLDWLKKFA